MGDYKFILIEGTDATGKTTTAENLADRIGGQPYQCPPKILKPIRDGIHEYSPEANYHFYLSGNLIAAEEISGFLKDQHVVSDRYIYSTLVHHSITMGRDLPMPELPLMPDHIIYVTATMDTIIERLGGRDNLQKHEKPAFMKEMQRRFLEYFKDLDNVLTVDTSELNEEQVVDFILENIEL
jgi:thymidylate kinase